MAVIANHQSFALAAGLMGNVISFLVFLAPLPTFYRVYKKKSTEGFHSIPYVVALFSAMVWLYYAALKKDVFLLITCNTVGLFVESAYILIYLLYSPKAAKIYTFKLLFLLNIVAFGLIVTFTLTLSHGTHRVAIIGWIGSAFSFCVFVAPLSIMRQVIVTKSVEFMPINLTIFLTLSAIAWFLYGFLLQDYYIALPNVLGFLFGVVQMILYSIYRDHKGKSSLGDKLPEHQATDIKLGALEKIEVQVEAKPKEADACIESSKG